MPRKVLYIKMKSWDWTAIESAAGDGRPVSTQVPPLRVSVSAVPTSAAPTMAGGEDRNVGHRVKGQIPHHC
ncbi:hypothetical protein LRC484719_50620 [Mycobacterium riyadhense]